MTLVFRNRKGQLNKLLGCIMNKKTLKHLTLTGDIQENISRWRQGVIYLRSLREWMRCTERHSKRQKIRAAKYRMLWKVSNTDILKGYST